MSEIMLVLIIMPVILVIMNEVLMKDKSLVMTLLDNTTSLFILYLTIIVILPGCATAPRPILECKQLCTGDRVEEFKDETTTCRCALKQEEQDNE